MTAHDIHWVAAEAVFGHLEPEQRTQIGQLIRAQTCPAGQLFYTPHDYGEQLFILQAGRVRLYKLSAEGRALTLAVLEPVTIFGEMTLVGQWLHDSFAEAMTECTIGIIKGDELRQILQQHPELSLRFMELMGQRLRAIESKLADIAFKNVPQRLATVLLNLAGSPGTSSTGQPPRVIRYTHQQLAEMIGSYRETVTKAIGEFREANLIHIDDEAIHLTDLEKLQHLAGR